MDRTPKRRAEYGGTSEQRQRDLEGDTFEESAPQTPEEIESVRSATEDTGGQVVTINALPGPVSEPWEK